MVDLSIPVAGSCLCGAVRYDVARFERGVIACHCSQCRETSGHYVAATQAMNANLRMISDSTLKWYRSSEDAERGFCTECGSNLFWRKIGDDATSIMVGALDGPTGLAMQCHIFVDDAGDYYCPSDGVPHYPQSD
jgi:hypothetical protein